MRQALREALKAYDKGEVPIGAIVVDELGKVIGKGYNQMESLKDPTAHAEILALGAAATTKNNWRLDGCTLFCTLEPCFMCAGALLNSRISVIYYGAEDKRMGGCGTQTNLVDGSFLDRKIEVIPGILRQDSLDLIQNFFREVRTKKGLSGKKIPE